MMFNPERRFSFLLLSCMRYVYFFDGRGAFEIEDGTFSVGEVE